ncbi:MAG: adenosylmethionine-8-amino-7-oxononanoate aminotransferase [Pirellulaceae bacterium]|nr:MAG: adenosylmethionine-8-amino-7-oxononanoate aminotransferase [Pirellulaceae bacterium]
MTFSYEKLAEWDLRHYWHAFTQMADYRPFIIERAEGVWLIDLEGNRYFDGVSSLWCNLLGHQHPAINRAILEQLQRVAHVTSLGMSNPAPILLARRLAELTPDPLQHVFYASDGACAVEVALKMAFQYWRQCDAPEPQRDLFLAVGNAYHGDTIGGVSVGGVARFHSMFDPLLFRVVRGPCPDAYRLPPGVQSATEATAAYLAAYRELFARYGHRLAAVIIEPLIQGAAGMVMHPPGFLAGLAELCREYGVLLIADEIAVGMGRTGRLWACQWENVVPDFLVIGKGISGGYLPLSAVVTSDRIFQAFLGPYAASRSFFHGHTFGGNPLACAAALATFDELHQGHWIDHVQHMEVVLREELQSLRDYPVVGDVRCKGLIAAVELVADRDRKHGFPWEEARGRQVCDAALQRGVWLRPLGNVIVVMPPLVATAEHCQLIVEAIRFGLQSVDWS